MAGWEAHQQGAPDPFFASGRNPKDAPAAEIGSESWVKAMIEQKLSPEERDRPKPGEGKYPILSLGSGS